MLFIGYILLRDSHLLSCQYITHKTIMISILYLLFVTILSKDPLPLGVLVCLEH